MTPHNFSVHAHFYQPPREDPLTGVIPPEEGAHPYLNWNERIHAECYRPNVERHNYSQISFNIGPTLFSWIEDNHPQTSAGIIAQDQENFRKYGIGNALAQPYNHTILPLASYQDKVTQIVWGIKEYEHRFGHKPQGMWLPEAAVDTETLCVMANQGIEFTILAPWQVQKTDVDVTQPYRISLPGGGSITVFLYHAGLSGGISFNPGLTVDADHFVKTELRQQFKHTDADQDHPQLILLATDGELYGHHQPLRDHFLTRLVNGASHLAGLEPTFPGLWLKHHPARQYIQIQEKTSWSCLHGVSRWNEGCDCTPGDPIWKGHFRKFFDHLALEIDRVYYNFVSQYFSDAWELRNRYIEVILGIVSLDELLAQMAGKKLPDKARLQIHLLLEAQRERQRVFTSCGFYFEDFNRIEPKNNLAYAVQALRLVRLATGIDLSEVAHNDLQRVNSQRSGLRGDLLFDQILRRAEQVDQTGASD